MLKDVTPLKTDCGEYCQNACCRDNGEAGSCVWLLPGEDDDSVMEWADVRIVTMPVTRSEAQAIFCRKLCQRDHRPFLCRIFPLSPYYSQKKQRWSVRMDRRAAAICPLFQFGKSGLRRDFLEAAECAVNMLASDQDYRQALEELEKEESAYRFEL